MDPGGGGTVSPLNLGDLYHEEIGLKTQRRKPNWAKLIELY